MQNRIADRATRYLTERIAAPFNIDYIEIDFFNRLRLEGIYVEDLSGDTLLYAQALEAQLSLFAPLQQEIRVQDFHLQHAVAKLYRGPDSLFNYQFIIDAFAGENTDTTSSAPWSFGLRQLQLEDVRFQLLDSISRTQVYTRVGHFDGLVNALDLQTQRLAIARIELAGSYAAISTRTLPDSMPADTVDSGPLAFPFTGWQLSAETIDLQGLAVSYNDFGQPPAPKQQFDPAHLNFEDIQLEAHDFQWDSSSLQLQLQQLAFRELNGFQLKQLAGELEMGLQQIQLQDLQLQTDGSRLAPSRATLRYDSFDKLTDFVESVEMEVDLQGGSLLLSDIQYWSGPIPYLSQNVRTRFGINGQLSGRVNELEVQKLQLQANDSTHLWAAGYIAGLPNVNELTVDLQVQKAQSSYRSLSRLLKDIELPEGLQQFGSFQLQTRIKGRIDSLRATTLRLRTESATAFDGRFWASGLPDTERLRFQLDIDSLQTIAADLKAFAPPSLPVQLDPLGRMRYSGKVSGTAYAFTVKGQLQTEAGQSTQDARIAFNNDYSDAAYEGKITLSQLNLGALIDDPAIGRTSLQLNATGEGLNLDSLQAKVAGTISLLEYNDYAYNSIKLDGQLKSRQFDGQLDITDPNLQFHFDGLANLNDSIPEFRFTAQLDTVNLEKLNFYDSPLHLQTRAEVALKGGQLDQLEGQASLQDLYISNDITQYETDLITLEARKESDSTRQLILRSDIVNAQINGQYELAKFSGAALDFVDTFFPIKRLLPADTRSADSLLLAPGFADQRFDFQVQLDEPTRLTKILLPALEKLDTAWIQGVFRGEERLMQLDGAIPALAYSGIYLDSILLDIDGNPQEMTAQLSAQTPRREGQVFAQRLQLNSRFYRDSLQLKLAVLGDSSRRKMLVNTLLSPAGDQRVQLQFLPPFYLNRQLWDLPANHQLILGADYVYAKNVRLSKGQQALYAQSEPGDSLNFPPLVVGFEQFNIQELTKLASLDADYLSGLLQGEARFDQRDGDLRYTFNFSIDDLTVDKELLGKLQLSAQPNERGNMLKLDAQLAGAENDLQLAGKYGFEDGALDFTIDSDGLQLAPIDFFSLGNTKDSRGQLTANLDIGGNTQAPKITGQIGLDSASTFVEYLQTRFLVPQHRLQLTETRLNIGQMKLLDNKGRSATLSGNIEHQGFDDIKLALNFNAPSFLVLDSKAGDNKLFYGKILVRADAQIRGPLSLPKIDITTTTLPSTDITVLPLSEEEAIVQEDFIIYGKPSEYQQDTSQANTQIYQTNTTGYDLSLRLNLTPDAQITAIIDPSTGDKLTAQGDANLLVEMKPSGQLTTTGNITLTSGRYFLNYEGIVKRSFKIREGSTIYLPGDPLNARFDITATYSTQTAVYALIQNEAQSLSSSQEQAARRRQPINVIMRMEGTLSEPNISFELETGRSVSGNIVEIVEEKFTRLQEDKNELNKQVFGLLLFNSFITSSGGGGDLGTAGENIALSSVSGLLSNQLNRLANQYVKGVDINVGVDSYVTDQSNTSVTEVELGLSKQLFNERLSVEVGGNLGVSESGNQSNTAIAGNFLLEYKLTEDGRYRVRVFRRPDYDVFTDGIRTGASLIYKKSFGEIQPDTTQTTNERDD